MEVCGLQELCRLRSAHQFLLMVDDAHGTLVLGKSGGGAAEWSGTSASVDVHVGTLSKAIGAHGGFVACSCAIKTLLVNKGRAYTYSTALPVPTVAGALAALSVLDRYEYATLVNMANILFRQVKMTLWSYARAESGGALIICTSYKTWFPDALVHRYSLRSCRWWWAVLTEL